MEITLKDGVAYAYTGGKAFDAGLPTVVFIHGGENDHSVWILQSRYLAHHGYGVLALDLPGHGRSGGPPLTRIEDLAAWLATAMAAAGVARATLVGHSMGSLIAIECAARYPDMIAGIALLGATLPMRVSPELLEATQNDEAAAHDMINIWSHAASAHYPSNPGPGFWVPGENLRLMQRQKPGVLHADFRACNDYSAGLESAARIACPALCIMGKRDLMTPPRSARELLKALKQVQTLEIAGSGHALMAEKPDEVLDGLRAFLAANRAPA
jgi:pimeloyl-ACP methyl ester carboxylesterase